MNNRNLELGRKKEYYITRRSNLTVEMIIELFIKSALTPRREKYNTR